MWNLSVRVKPENYPLGTFVDAEGFNYDIVFSGYNAKTTDLFNSFKVTGSVSNAAGKRFVECGKRAYAGAEKENVTGSVTYYSDVLLIIIIIVITLRIPIFNNML